MPRFVYTPDMLAFIASAYRKTCDLVQIATDFNQRFGTDKTPENIKSTISNHKLHHGRGRHRPQPHNRMLTPEQEQWLRDAYQRMTLANVVDALNQRFDLSLTFNQVKAYTKNHKITSGRTGCFEKGITPWNTGKKGYMGANATSFKPGQKPINQRPFASERICSKDGYVIIKTEAINPYTGHLGYWRHKHVVIWEQHHGPAPEGMIVVFKDSDKTNVTIDNLELISRAEHAVRNKLSYSSYDPEIKPTVALLAKLAQAKRRRQKELKS